MARRGPKPVPTALKVVRGTDQPCRVKKNEPKPKTDSIKRPFKLSHIASLQWTKVSRQLKAAKLLTNIDTHALALYCESYATYIEAKGLIREQGVVVDGLNGAEKQSAYFLVANKAQDQMLKLMVEFGMTPSSRTRVSAAVGPDDDEF